MKWIEQDQGEWSKFVAADRFTLEPDDLDFDEWSLFDGAVHVMDGTRAECEAMAETLMENDT